MNIKIKPETFVLGSMEKNLEIFWGTLMLYMLTAARLLYTQKWKNTLIPTMDKWLQKLKELAEMAKLTTLINEKKHNYSCFYLETASDLCA